MRKLILMIGLIAIMFSPFQRNNLVKQRIENNSITVQLDFDDDDLPEFIFF